MAGQSSCEDETDDLPPDRLLVIVNISESNPFSNRVFVWKNVLREFLVDDHHAWTVFTIAIRVSATLQDGDTHRAEVIRTYYAIIHTRPLVGCGNGTAFHTKSRRWSFV
jgi:hypothetical protein